VVAVDIQNKMLEKVKQKAVGFENIDLKLGALGSGVMEINKYDYILLVNVLGEIPKQIEALQEIFHALKSGGVLSVTETVFDPHYQRIKSLEVLTESMGFKKAQVFGKWYSYTVHFIANKQSDNQ
jgi:ubiquinone/menaquinone biosynthesis C-methylase UbiE